MGDTKIQWAEKVWNPVAGCSRVSAGCDHCYALAMARQLQGKGTKGHKGLVKAKGWTGTVRCLPERLEQPLHWRDPRMVFVCSMGDLFHEAVPVEFVAKVWAVMIRCRQHTFQALTKRPERMAAIVGSEEFQDMVLHQLTYTEEYYCPACRAWYDGVGRLNHCPNCGHEYSVSVSSSKDDDPVCPKCGEVEYENTCPKCGLDGGNGGLCCSEVWGPAIDATWIPDWPIPNIWLGTSVENQAAAKERIPHLLKCPAAVRFLSCEPLIGPLDNLPLDGIGWVIVGGESGPGARLCKLEWIRSIIKQCRAAGVAVFVEQLGARNDFRGRWRLSGKNADPDRWPPDLRVREYPAAVRDGAR